MPQGYFGLASGTDEGTMAAPVQLFVGEAPIKTDSAQAAANIAQYQVCVLEANGTLTVAEDSDDPKKCVIAQIAATNGARCPYYSAGHFNHEVIVFPVSLNTLDKRKEFFSGTPIFMGHLLP